MTSLDLDLERAELAVARLRTRATIVQRRDRGPMRPAGRRRGYRPGGLYASAKTGRMVGWESRAELWGFHHAEVATEVVNYRAQPHTIEAIEGGRLLIYTPDREDLLADGGHRIVEVREDFEAKRDPAFAQKLALFGEVYRSLGWDFQVVAPEELTAEPLFGAVEEVQRLRRAAFTVADLDRVREALADGARPFGELVSLFDGELLGRSILCAMMVVRYVAIDLSAGLDEAALVTLV